MSISNIGHGKLATCYIVGAENNGKQRFAAISPPAKDVIRLLTADNRSQPINSRTD
jgi:hypothetical protein